MTLEETKKRVAGIIENHGDYEMAHGEEDKLMQDFVQYVAKHNVPIHESKAIAQEICKVFELDFPRYCT